MLSSKKRKNMNITITGRPCSGKSTIAKLIAEKHNFKRIGVGDIFKEEAKKRNMSAEEFNAYCMKDPSFDFFIDNQTRKLGEELVDKDIIFDSRMAWHFVPKSFKVFVDLNDEEMARRLVNSDREGKEKFSDLKAAKESLLNRERLEVERYKKLYNADLSDLSNFDFVIDSSNKTPEELEEKVWKAYQKFVKTK